MTSRIPPQTCVQLKTFFSERNSELKCVSSIHYKTKVVTQLSIDEDSPRTINRNIECEFICCKCKENKTLRADKVVHNYLFGEEVFCKGCAHSNTLTTTTMEDFKNKADDNGYILIDERTEYNKNKHYKVKCKKGHISEKTYAHLSSGCMICANQSKVKCSEDIVYNIQANRIFKVLEIKRYNNKIDSEILVKCNQCGDIFTECYDNLYSNTDGCSSCYRMARTWPAEARLALYKDNDCKLLSKSGSTFEEIQKIQCKCGEIFYKSFRNFKDAPRCESCSQKLTEETNLRTRGVKNPGQDEKCKEKGRATNLERRGVEYASQDPEVKLKAYITNIDNHNGVHNLTLPEVRVKADMAKFLKFGSYTNLHTPQFKELMMKKYNREHAMQVASIFHASKRYVKHKFTFKNGVEVEAQGYERFALRDLQEILPIENIIIGTTNMPSINYQLDGVDHVYFPDIFVNDPGFLIEVKSIYTFLTDYEKNIEKWTAASKLYPIHIWVYSSFGVRLETLEFNETSDIRACYFFEDRFRVKYSMYKFFEFNILTPISEVTSMEKVVSVKCKHGHEFTTSLRTEIPKCKTCVSTGKIIDIFLPYKLLVSDWYPNISREQHISCVCTVCNKHHSITMNNLRTKEVGKLCNCVSENRTVTKKMLVRRQPKN